MKLWGPEFPVRRAATVGQLRGGALVLSHAGAHKGAQVQELRAGRPRGGGCGGGRWGGGELPPVRSGGIGREETEAAEPGILVGARSAAAATETEEEHEREAQEGESEEW